MTNIGNHKDLVHQPGESDDTKAVYRQEDLKTLHLADDPSPGQDRISADVLEAYKEFEKVKVVRK